MILFCLNSIGSLLEAWVHVVQSSLKIALGDWGETMNLKTFGNESKIYLHEILHEKYKALIYIFCCSFVLHTGS